MNLSKIINVVFGLLFAGITLWAVTAFVGMQTELKARQADLATKQRLLAEAEAKLADQTRYLERLRSDPALVELLIRQKLGYAKGHAKATIDTMVYTGLIRYHLLHEAAGEVGANPAVPLGLGYWQIGRE